MDGPDGPIAGPPKIHLQIVFGDGRGPRVGQFRWVGMGAVGRRTFQVHSVLCETPHSDAFVDFGAVWSLKLVLTGWKYADQSVTNLNYTKIVHGACCSLHA